MGHQATGHPIELRYSIGATGGTKVVLEFPPGRATTPRKGVIDQPEILTLFGTQFGVATSAQLLNLGVSRRAIVRAQERGTLIRVLPGLYRLAGYAGSFEASRCRHSSIADRVRSGQRDRRLIPRSATDG
jgi:hypothetical protein